MKKIILLALATLMMVGCDIETREHKQEHEQKEQRVFEWNNQVVIIDSCEYISEEMRGLVEHKGNCRFCKVRDSLKWERRKKELKELVEQLKEK